MEQRSVFSIARERQLHVARPILHLHRSAHSVTLEDRCVRMSESSDKQHNQQKHHHQEHHHQQQQQAATATSSSSTLLAATLPVISSPPPVTTSLPPTSVPISSVSQSLCASGSQTHHQTTKTAATSTITTSNTSTNVAPTSSSSSLSSLSSPSSSTTITSSSTTKTTDTSAIKTGPSLKTPKQIYTGDAASKAPTEKVLSCRTSSISIKDQGHSTKSTLAPPLSPTILKTSDASSLPKPVSPTPSRGKDGRDKKEQLQQEVSTDIVGGKRPLTEDKLTLRVPDLHFEREVKAASISPDVASDGSASSWSQPHSQRTRSATTTSKLSTREQFLLGDQPFRDKSHSEGKLSVQFSLAPPPKRDEAHIMEFFQEQEKNLQERFLSLPKQAPRKQRSPSPNIQQKLGLEHLDNLVRLMQQLTSLKDENSRLRKRCDYLESTKNLLQAKKDLNGEDQQSSPAGSSTPSAKHRSHSHKQPSKTTMYPLVGSRSRTRLSSSEDIDHLEIADSSSDQRPKHPKKTLHKRSFSTGSIEIDLLDCEVADISSDDKTSKSKFVGKKPKSKSSKWARVKKVLTGQKLYEDLNTTIKSLKEFGKSTHIRYLGSSSHDPNTTDPSPRSTLTRTYRRSDSIPTFRHGEEFDKDVAHPTYSGYQVMESTEAVDLSTDIWMGPADWWEEYEANKEGATSASSDVSSVIEVTTMYLGAKQPDMSTSQTTSTSTSSSSSATTTTAMATSSTHESLFYLDPSLATSSLRRSSHAYSTQDDEEDDASLLEELATRTEPVRILHKSSSCKSAELDLPKTSSDGKETTKKFHKTAWGRVKDIIHTRKGSISKRKPRKDKSGTMTEPEETSEIDIDALLDESWHTDFFAEGLLSRSTPKSSPMMIRQSQPVVMAKRAESADSKGGATSLSKSATSAMTSSSSSHGTVDMAALIGRSMSDDFNKKMQEWEEMKSKKSSVKPSVDESELCSLDVSGASQELKTVDLKDLKGKIPEACSESLVTEDSNTSTEVFGMPSVHAEDMAKKKMTESFSRKMQEWERMKYKSSPGPIREPSPEMERKGSKGRKEERQKSKRSREEKEKEKLERQREREMQKVEREQVKLDKEKLRIEKERLRALEREAKLEKLKGRLSQPDSEGMAKNPVLSPLAEYKVTADFAHKLHQWELRKGLSHAVSNSVYLEAHKIKSMHQLKESAASERSSRPDSTTRFPFDSVSPETQDQGSALMTSYWDSPDDTSPIEKYSEPSIEETSVVTDECRTTSNIPTLERANAQLLQELRKKELEYQAVQEEVQSLNQKLANVKEDHAAEMARFHREVEQGTVTGPVKLEMGELERTIGDVEDRIKLMENFGESLAKSMESAAVGKKQSIEGEESVHMQLVELVGQMRSMLIQATQSEEASQKSSALSNFEVLYSQAMKLQVQMNNLRLSHLERNREIMVIKRQLLLQEVNNLVLQADISRREAELYQFHEAKVWSSPLRRWNTFSGHRSDRQRPQAQIELPTTLTKPRAGVGMTKSVSDRDSKMQGYHERGTPLGTKSAPCSPLAKTTDEELSFLPAGGLASESRTNIEGQSTDRQESYMLTPEAAKQQRQSTQHLKELTAKVADSTSDKGVPTASSTQTPPPQEQTSPSKVAVTTHVDSSAQNISQSEEISKTLSTILECKTQFDSLPLQQEIEALRKEKSKVEKGSPTLIESCPAPSTGQRLKVNTSNSETHPQTIPRQSSLALKPRLLKTAQLIDYDFPIAQSVMECVQHSPTTDHTIQPTVSTPGSEGESLTTASPSSPSNLSTLPPIADQTRAGSRSPRSPVSKHKLLRRQKEKEEREIKSKDYSAVSPKGSPVAARGKPPLPRQDKAFRHSPSSSPSISDRGIRSRSHEEMESLPRSSTVKKPLQDTINRFEKRATIHETEERTIELRKTPSPTLHLPRVGLVSRVRKLKPAAELLEESQRYRSGQSVYATRIMQKYLPKEESKSETHDGKHNKENVSGSYVHAMVQRLSRESTPARSGGSSRTTSTSSLHPTDSPRAHSEFVSHIVRKLSSSSGPESPSSITPLSDLTNEGQVKELTKAYAIENESGPSKDQARDESDMVKHNVQHRLPASSQHPQERRSCEVAMVLSPKSSSISESYTLVSAVSTGSVPTCYEISSTTVTAPTNHTSLPCLPSPGSLPISSSSSSHEPSIRSKSTAQRKDVSFDIEPDFSSITSCSSVFRSPSEEEEQEELSKRKKEKRKKGEPRRLLSSLSPVRRGTGRGKMETVGVLCKQSISFDLGVSTYAKDEPSSSLIKAVKSRKPRSWDPSESLTAEATAAAGASAPSTSRSTSAIECGEVMTSSLEGEIAPSSPTSAGKKKSKRFLDAAWLQKSKKFFKVSK